MRSKEDILEEQAKILYRGKDNTVEARKIPPIDQSKLIDLNIELLEFYMPHDDPDVQRRAKRTIAHLEQQVYIRP